MVARGDKDYEPREPCKPLESKSKRRAAVCDRRLERSLILDLPSRGASRPGPLLERFSSFDWCVDTLAPFSI